MAINIFAERAKLLEVQGENVIYFEIREPDFDTPKNIVGAGKKH